MRKRFEQQLEVDSLSIADVVFNTRSRHELPQILSGLQYIFVTPGLNSRIFELLESEVLKDKQATGRKGMSLWEILVLSCVRHGLNCDYDELHNLANQHQNIRGILGVHKLSLDWSKQKVYALQTIKDNVSLLSEDILKKINEEVIKWGHKLLKKKKSRKKAGRSFWI